jgi:exopolysaccharide production protein ExoZ
MSRLYSLQWLRFAAALAVAIYHGTGYLRIIKGDGTVDTFVPQWFGQLGVAIFFALSGFLMGGAMLRQDASQFLLHRVARIYPALIFATLCVYATIPFISLFPAPDWRVFTVIPAGVGVQYPLSVEWTLLFEICFYVFLAAVIFFNQRDNIAPITVGWLGIILAHNILAPDDPSKNLFPPHMMPFIGVNVAFGAGLLLSRTKLSLHPILAAIIGFDIWLVPQAPFGITGARWGLGIGSAVLVASLAGFSRWQTIFGNTFWGHLGNKLGDYSYALYLVHVPIFRLVYTALPFKGWPAFMLAMFAVFSASAALGEADIRTYRFLKSKIDASGKTVRSTLAACYIFLFIAVLSASYVLP